MDTMKKIGCVLPKKSKDIKNSKIGLGFEKLDRDIFDPKDSYPFVAESGVKWARLQSGWQKTEKEKGVYDFSWLDEIVDKMIEIGVEPWLCLCYGNKLYTKDAENVFGAVGCPPIKTEEERCGWDSYVRATVSHFKGRIHYYEIWNEPDGKWCWKHGPNADELADFTIATARACKEADSTCEVIGFVMCMSSPEFCERLCELGVCDHIDAISYHAYTVNEESFTEIFNRYDSIRKKYNPKLKIIQGESGTQSRSDGCGALAGGAWTEEKQVKFLLRHLITDIHLGAEFTSYFSCMDMAEALNGSTDDIKSISDFGYFGVVGADFDENARATGNYHAKPSFKALQTLAAILCENYENVDAQVIPCDDYSPKMLGCGFDFDKAKKCLFNRENKSFALAYWVPKNILTETYEGYTSFKLRLEDKPTDIRLIDLASGLIYAVNDENTSFEDGYVHLKNIPITDSPLLLDFNNFYKEC